MELFLTIAQWRYVHGSKLFDAKKAHEPNIARNRLTCSLHG
jgi:hypothetical protein